MPAYNTEEYIADAIQSALRQTYSNLELLVVDDGSTDRTRDIAMEWAATDDRVRVFTQGNKGISGARNTGIRHSTGDVFALLDSDDVWAPTFLARQLAVLDDFPDVAVVTGNAFNRGGDLDGRPVRVQPPRCRRLTLLDILGSEDSMCVMSVFRRAVVERIGGFDERLRMNEDYQFWVRAAAAGFGFMQTPWPLGYYRRRSDSVSAVEARMLDGVLLLMPELRAMFEDDPPALAVIDRQTAKYEHRRMVVHGKEALAARRFDEAAIVFLAIHRRSGAGKFLAISAACRLLPRTLFWAYQWSLRRGRPHAAAS
jgi:glycosyltransferase involved in cell wall biosynthesis